MEGPVQVQYLVFILIPFLHVLSSSCLLNSVAFIVSFDGYYDQSHRTQLINNGLNLRESMNIEKRRLIFSDFDVVEVCDCNKTFMKSALKNLPHVVHVTNNYRFPLLKNRQLQSVRGPATNLDISEIQQVTKLLNVSKLWDMGFKGQGVKVAVFDTGLARYHKHFKHIAERTDWTNEQTADDGLGHGTFVAGVIASSNQRCPGFAPESHLYIYKVFTKKQVSYTSWFLDAFNHAILRGINILNLSIGGPDFTDLPFMDKVWELTANGVILISAIGNDGPRFGTLNTPADQMDVIGVGGINLDLKVARFSSRGMTTWELPGGYGRLKPDVVTYGTSVYGSALDHGCRALSGTSVASPVVAGATAVILSGIEDRRLWNPAVVKQALIAGAKRLQNSASMFEQGAGKIDILDSFHVIRKYYPKITLIPPYVDFTECPYMWPYCSQPLYASAIPTIINVTILNGLGVSGRIFEPPIWEPFMEENGNLLNVSIIYQEVLWPWSGYMAVYLSISSGGDSFEGVVGGRVTVKVSANSNGRNLQSSAIFSIRVRIIPTPPRRFRLLWDLYRNMRYPPGYLPRDDLRDRGNPLDWTADHPHTNFKPLYQTLRSSGYYIEVLGEPLTCVNLTQYWAYILVDPEDEFFPSEIDGLFTAVNDFGLNLIVFADWYNATVIDKIRFMDENTKRWWQPETGGSNLPALNDLLARWNVAFGNQVLEGTVLFNDFSASILSGAPLIQYPSGSYIVTANFTDLGTEIISGEKSSNVLEETIFVFYKNKSSERSKSGFLAVLGDSSCLELGTESNQKSCIVLLSALIETAYSYDMVTSLRRRLKLREIQRSVTEVERLPQRITTSNFSKFSKVVAGFTADGALVFHNNPSCKVPTFRIPRLLYNATLPSDLFRAYQILDYDNSVYGDVGLFSTSDEIKDSEISFGSNDKGEVESISSTVESNQWLSTPYFLWLIMFFILILCCNGNIFRRRIRKLKRLWQSIA